MASAGCCDVLSATTLDPAPCARCAAFSVPSSHIVAEMPLTASVARSSARSTAEGPADARAMAARSMWRLFRSRSCWTSSRFAAISRACKSSEPILLPVAAAWDTDACLAQVFCATAGACWGTSARRRGVFGPRALAGPSITSALLRSACKLTQPSVA